ncbi:mitochondrial DNA polymerase I protein D, putative [Trypanosoma equiperdum]|uniref:DNA-directed DNA polymerase n=3 Tax=Trypanozoon TaxID=39700 RepID=Q386I5_TRYB2|nr:mitochondrial DNA polymerase I protein D, putative [Trypanosoma brucei brucei TREU927]AAM81965.1 DNA polymerase I-like protein D [Trypanosoma brucei]EAN79296.1 mitochondrial DNA polymerase I protein D, putative [Trypanosoma brucei brucei TREU927]SCU69498.1 mitochondrial DNA polymerase I protein D, putative [Trypanosoma equiperdum]
MLRRLFKPQLMVPWSRQPPTCCSSQIINIISRGLSQRGEPLGAAAPSSVSSVSVPPVASLHTPVMHSNAFAASEVKKLLAKAQYSLFTLGWNPGTDDYCIYCATTNELVRAKKDTLWKAIFWMEGRIGDDYIAGLLFPSDGTPALTEVAAMVREKCRRQVVVAPDTWGICYLTLKNQRDFVRGMELPASLEHAAFLLMRAMFNSSLIEPSVFDVTSGAYISASCADSVSAARDCLVSWWVLFNVHKKFGTSGSRKLIDPVEQIVRRVVKTVNVFVVDINVRVGKGTISEGFTMIVTIYDAQRRSQSVHMIRSLAEESAKRNTLNGLLFGEGTSAISLFVPTDRTKSSQLLAFARSCRPSCPFFVTEPSSLTPFFSGAPVTDGLSEQSDPRSTWALIRTNCFAQCPGRRLEEVLDRKLLQGFTAVANRLYSDRLHRVSPALMSAASSIPLREEPRVAWERVASLVEEERKNPVAHVNKSAFLNNVTITDAEVVFRLQQWHSTIYESPDRLEREREALEGLQRYLVVDLETTTVRRYKRVANPFTKENYVVLSGARDYRGQVFMPSRYYSRNVALRYDDLHVTSTHSLVKGSSKHSLFLPPLDDYDVLVGHNIKFDLLHMWRDVELRRFLKRGGKIWDTMYAEYLLTGHEVKLGHGAGLEEVAKSYGGQTPKLDAVKQAWSSGKDTCEIPYRTLTQYLHGDLENTELIFKKHIERALAQRQVVIILARMDGLLCTTEMEYNGLKTNVQLALSQSNELMCKVKELRRHLDNSIPKEISIDCRKYFNWASNQHLIAFFFGGKLKLSTNARESRLLPGEVFERHTLYARPEDYDKTEFPKGVFLRPPVYVVGPADCLMATGVSLDKGTKFFKMYFEAYVKQAGFRKSSSVTDSLRRAMVSVSRIDQEKCSNPDALVNLLPKRHLFLFAAFTPTSDGTISKLFLKNAITGESLTIAGDCANKVERLRAFMEGQVEAHTEMLVDADGDGSAPANNNAFADAHITILARDAPFSCARLLHSDEGISAYLSLHDGLNPQEDVGQRYVITLADTVSTLSYYRYMYGSDTEAAYADKTKVDESKLVVPMKALPRPCSSRGATSEAFKKKLVQEAAMKPEDWCNLYIDIFLHIGHAALCRESLETEAGSKKARKSKGKGGIRTPGDLPILLRERSAFIGYYNSLPDDERKKLALMTMLGRTCGTAFDAFAVMCSHDDIVEVNIGGRLNQYVPSQLDAEQVMRKFRSPTTRQLQVGEDSLTYFKKTHGDKTAETILELRAMEKLIGTYYENTDDGTGMVSLVHDDDSCIHHELIHNKTNTGRLASANPNCQNIPKEDKSPLREMFVSRYGEKGMCIEADYSQLEVVALAVLANDQQMLEDLRSNVDFHCKRVAMMRPDLQYTEILKKAKKDKEPEFVKLRQQAKIFSFQRQYGAGVKMISESTGLTQDQVRHLIEKERETYRGVDVFNSMVALSANKFDASLQNGSRNVRGHQIFKGMFPVITGSRYIFTESDVPEGLLRNKSLAVKSTNFSPTHLKNYPVQGFAGEIVQIMLGVLWRHFLRKDNYGGLAVLINTVHDCVWIDCHMDVLQDVVLETDGIMSSVRDVLNRLYPEMEVSVDFPCDVVAGENMGALRPVVIEETL